MPGGSRLWLGIGAVNGLLAVAAGAYGRHGALEPAGREMFGIAAHYQMVHALALLAVAWLATAAAGRWWGPEHLAGAAFAAGIVLFCGSLYAFGVTGLVPLEGAAPAGGYCLMAGWLLLLWRAVRGARG